jgi:hypothetical protein
MGEKKAQSGESSGPDEKAGEFWSADFSGASPVASALGIRGALGRRDPSRKIDAAISRSEFRGS